jgi:hypothetical protein
VPLAQLPTIIPALHFEPANTLFVVMSNDEVAATEAWKTLVAESVPNVYILEGGVNGWIDVFADEAFKETHAAKPAGPDQLRYTFAAAIGDKHTAAEPDHHAFELEYIPKVEMELKRAPASGGCG